MTIVDYEAKPNALLKALLEFDARHATTNNLNGISSTRTGYEVDYESPLIEYRKAKPTQAAKIFRQKILKEFGPCHICGKEADLFRDYYAMFKKDGRKRKYSSLWVQKLDVIRKELAVNYFVVCTMCRSNGRARQLELKTIKHGTLSGYRTYQCRCDECVGAYENRAVIQKVFKFNPRKRLT